MWSRKAVLRSSQWRIPVRADLTRRFTNEKACFSTLLSHAPCVPNRRHQEDERPAMITTRFFHATASRDFAPFLPEIIVGVGLGIGWVLYRTSQGKPLTPDQALASQQAYQKMQQDLMRRNQRYESRMSASRRSTSSEQSTSTPERT